MARVTAVLGDITTQRVDVVVNAANTAMRGGGGVDGAIHRAGGPAILRECIARFPRGLATGDAGWTTAGDLPATWVVHTVGPNHAGGQRDRSLLESCYRRSLAVADELGARSMAFPLVSAGIYAWPLADAIATAVGTLSSTPTAVDEIRIVTREENLHRRVAAEILGWTPLRILQGVAALHDRGFHRLRVLPGMSASGAHYRVTVTGPDSDVDVLRYSTGGGTAFAGGEVALEAAPDDVAGLILAALPHLRPTADDPAYAVWYRDLLARVDGPAALPVAYADSFDRAAGWELGWGSGIRHRPPPPLP